MPYIVLALGIIIGVFALLRLFTKSDPAQIKTAMRIILLGIYSIIMLFFAFRGSIIVSLLLLAFLIPFIFSYLKETKESRQGDKEQKGDSDQEKD